MTIKDDVVRVHGEHPEWTAKVIADHLGIERYHVYNNARAEGLKLPAAPMPVVPMQTLPAVVVAPSRDAVDVTVFATKPHEMAAAQQALIGWAIERIAEARAEADDAGAGLDIAIKNGWSTGAFERIANRTARMVTFYEKIKTALDAGYYIVPPFPLDIFTIRTNRRTPNKKTTTYRWDQRLQSSQLLAVGDGRYISDEPVIYQRTLTGAGPKGEDVKQFFAGEFRDVSFPFAMAKPQVMEATAAAMALKVFDQLGALPNSRGADPIICGQILKPNEWHTPVTFFIAWWLDTRTL